MPLGPTKMLLYSAGSIGAGAFYAFNNFVLPLVLKSLNAPDLVTGLLSSTRSIEGAVIQPTVGAASDRLWTPLGRRRPFIAVGIPLSALFFVVAAIYPHTLLGLAIAIFLFSIFFNAAIDPYAALLADITPFEQRSFLSGLSQGIQLIAQVGFLLLLFLAAGDSLPAWAYLVVAGAMLVSFAVTVLGIGERRELIAHTESRPLQEYVGALLEHRQAMRYLGTLFVYQFGLNAILPYLTLFITQDIGESDQIAFGLAALVLLVTALSAIAFGKLAERTGPKAVLAVGWAILAVAALGGTAIHGLAQTVIVVVLAGIGNGAPTAVAWPLLTALVPPEKAGVFAGLKASSESIAIPLSVVVAAELFLPRLGYRGIFAMLAISILVALALLLRFVRIPKVPTAAT